MIRPFATLAVAFVCATGVLLAGPAPALAATTQQVASGLRLPLFVTHAPGDPYRIYVVEKGGLIKIVDLRNPAAPPLVFLDIDDRVLNTSQVFDEHGLLGLAFHPDHANNGYFYVNYINNSGNTQISRFTRSGPDSASPASESAVISYTQPQLNHNGGWMAFGPNDGYLYIATGDGGGGGDDDAGHTLGTGNGQDITSNLLGKILRIDVDGDDFASASLNYAIPADNPFVGVTGDDEIWCFGLRNPWRPSFDRVTGDFYIADVGQNIWEEINFQPGDSDGGENYGWRCYEADANFNLANCAAAGTMVFPFLTYRHSNPTTPPTNATGCSITGGYSYRGCALPEFNGHYFFTDYCAGRIFSLRYTGAMGTPYDSFAERTAELDPPGSDSLFTIVSFGEDFFGEMYVVLHSVANGQVWKIVPNDPITDCNANNILDECEIDAGLVNDLDDNGVPDECQPFCLGDANGDKVVDFDDLVTVLGEWLADYTPGTGLGDADGNGIVDFDDLVAVLGQWLVPCP